MCSLTLPRSCLWPNTILFSGGATYLFYPFIRGWTFGRFPPLTIMNKAAGHMCAHVLMWLCFCSVGCAPGLPCWANSKPRASALWAPPDPFASPTSIFKRWSQDLSQLGRRNFPLQRCPLALGRPGGQRLPLCTGQEGVQSLPGF